MLSPTASDNPSAMLMTITNTDRRSVSPLTPSPSRELRGLKLFRAIGRKLSRRSAEEISFEGDADSRSSSTDSCSSTSARRCSRMKKSEVSTSGDSGFRSISPNFIISSCSSDTSSEGQFGRQARHHSTSAESIRKVFQNLTIAHRSQSCTNTKENKRKPSKKSTPKRILRSPVAYTYVKGLSGLPTQRIPKKQCRVYLNSTSCSCNVQYTNGLNR